ncbi:hypothetical protein EV702DRAFT_1179920 [Suillus placidus]|uniref:CxC1-like cysteine cluster associated with KDZ transposases domain-containing protein n=1 Tax=Suillus placidus TaxID=48579 RepID=A0A9P6ZT54_9AGAM|nr:hypothetical protein EV702DRAFT_1179920 [Suillus placidus]
MAVRRPKPRCREPSTSKVISRTQEECPSIPPPITIVCEPWMNVAWQRPRQTRKFNLYLPNPPPVLVLPGCQRLTQQNFCRLFSQKRANQCHRWSQDVILSLLVPYLSYIQQTSVLHYTNIPGEAQQDLAVCQAGCRTQSITFACVHFDALKEISIITCPCFPVPLQLLRRSLFPCAPLAPSLAVDLCILEFICLLFVCQAPNQTAWCDAVETFLDGMGYKLSCKVSLSNPLANTFHWYRVLSILACNHISTVIADVQRGQARIPLIDQPSEYLRSRCLLSCIVPLLIDNTSPDVIVCIDACFTQKCSTNPHSASSIDPLNPTPTFFLSNDDVKAMEDFVKSCRGERRRTRALRVEEEEDHYEEGMQSFIAADEKREKESTHFFTNTGLMALLCRHDRVLWLQHYALALLDHCRKWNLLDDNTLLRISFAVAIIYHPRKREGFGLSDGEGCEQLWSSLKQLIPSLRVSGFHQRLFVLNVQIRHLDTKSIQGYGHWLHQRWLHCQIKKNAALDGLLDLGINEDILRAEWKAQIAHQMRPIPRQSKNKAAEVITTILALEKTLDANETSVRELEMQLYVGAIANVVEFNLQLADARNKPAILKLVSTYNGLSPPSAIPPHPIAHEGIFLLDMDNEIWQDIGLDDDGIHLPAWLSDEATRSGIRLQLELDRCIEEETCLMRERSVMQEWMLAEWEAIQTALRDPANDLVMPFHLRACTEELLCICVVWKNKVREIPCAWPVESWDQVQSSFFQDDDDDESVGVVDESDEDGDLAYSEVGDNELMDAIEEVALADEYRYQDEDLIDDIDIEDSFMPSSPTKSTPKKWCCI